MIYYVRAVRMDNNGEVTEGKRVQTIVWPHELKVGGLYFLRKGKLYRVLGKADN